MTKKISRGGYARTRPIAVTADLIAIDKTPQRAVPRVQREGKGGQAARRDHHQIDIAARRHRLHLPLHKHPEVGGIGVGIKRRERQDTQFHHNVRTSISATAIHAGLSTTTWREPAPGGSTATRWASRSIIRPNANRPPGRGTNTSRLSRRG